MGLKTSRRKVAANVLFKRIKQKAMKTDNTFTPVIIRCPECNTIQAAIIEYTEPWCTYIHHCVICEYIIMESEREEVKPFKIEKP